MQRQGQQLNAHLEHLQDAHGQVDAELQEQVEKLGSVEARVGDAVIEHRRSKGYADDFETLEEKKFNAEGLRETNANVLYTLGQLARAVEALARQHPGTIAERKPTGVVLHYRRVPDLEARLVSRMSDLAATHPGIELHRAKMALELRPDDIGKDIAVGLLRSRQPFDCKKAILFGDDATDEVAMRYLLDHGDLACKVGTGETGAPLRAKDPTELRAALWMWTSGEGSKAWPSKD